MRLQGFCFSFLIFCVSLFEAAGAQSPPGQSPPPASSTSKHALLRSLAQRPFRLMMLFRWRSSTITICWLPAPRSSRTRRKKRRRICGRTRYLLGDAQFLPIFQPSQFSADYIDNTAQFDLGVSYLFERGKKRQHRLQAAKDQTAVTRRRWPTTSAVSPSMSLRSSSMSNLLNQRWNWRTRISRVFKTRWILARRVTKRAT